MALSRFVIQNDLSTPVILNIEPESTQFLLAAGEKLTVCDTFENDCVTLAQPGKLELPEPLTTQARLAAGGESC